MILVLFILTDVVGSVMLSLTRLRLEKAPVGVEHIEAHPVDFGSGKLYIGLTVLKRGYEHPGDNAELARLLRENLYRSHTPAYPVGAESCGYISIAVPSSYTPKELDTTFYKEIFLAVNSVTDESTKEPCKILVQTGAEFDVKRDQASPQKGAFSWLLFPPGRPFRGFFTHPNLSYTF